MLKVIIYTSKTYRHLQQETSLANRRVLPKELNTVPEDHKVFSVKHNPSLLIVEYSWRGLSHLERSLFDLEMSNFNSVTFCHSTEVFLTSTNVSYFYSGLVEDIPSGQQ